MADTNDQLIELMLSLKKTTPSAARDILNNTPPQIAQSLIKLMVSMDAVNYEVVQNTLTEYSKAQIAATPAPAPAPAAAPSTYPDPRSRPPPPSNYPPQAPSRSGYNSYTLPPPAQQPAAHVPSVYPPPPAQSNGLAPIQQSVLNTIAAMPEDQRAMILQVLQMSPEQVNMLGPAERTGIIQLRASLGVST